MAALATSLSSFRLSTVLFNSSTKAYPNKRNFSPFHQQRLRVVAATEGSAKSKEDVGNGNDPSVPSWAQPGSDEPPPWARQESQKDSSGFQLPFYVYLLASAITAIAAVYKFL